MSQVKINSLDVVADNDVMEYVLSEDRDLIQGKYLRDDQSYNDYQEALVILDKLSSRNEVLYRASDPNKPFESHYVEVVFLEPDHQPVNVKKLRKILKLIGKQEVTIVSAEDSEIIKQIDQRSISTPAMMCFTCQLYKSISTN